MDHAHFFLMNFLIFLVILYIDRRNARDYLFLSLLGLTLALIFENATTYIGLWHYHSEPKILLLSLYTWLLYVPYLGYCYFLGNWLARHV